MQNPFRSISRRHIATRTAVSVGLMSAFILLLAPLQRFINVTTIGFSLLLAVLFISIQMGSRAALAACVVAMLGYNFFFLPPVLTLTIQDPQNWVALAAFSITALVTGQLSASARRRASEAETSKQKAEQLYSELQAAFEVASQAEAIKRSELMKSALLDAVTHDLRTPLTSIRAASTTLHKAHDAGQDLDYEVFGELIELVDEESLHLDQLISNFVELARVEAGQLTLTTTWSSISDVTQAAVKRAGKLLRRHRLAIVVPETLPLVRIDTRALSEVLYTLLDNARKYSPDGSEITVSAREQGESIEVSVQDEGPGIPVAESTRVFEKFYRSRDLRSDAPGGLGVGLAIAKAIIEAHRGTIRVVDNPGARGATLAFCIPIHEQDLPKGPDEP
jgi:K+-sensing histidine kinase KdpD